jgi:hypothetical protein
MRLPSGSSTTKALGDHQVGDTIVGGPLVVVEGRVKLAGIALQDHEAGSPFSVAFAVNHEQLVSWQGAEHCT